MDAKAALKEAKAYLKDGDCLKAMETCQKILKHNKNNYNALVVMSVAMKDINGHKAQAPNALRKAIELQPDNPLAWQGLVAYYEKQPDNLDTWTPLLPVYCQFLQIDRSIFNHHLTQSFIP